jgi:hypothetical protein
VAKSNKSNKKRPAPPKEKSKAKTRQGKWKAPFLATLAQTGNVSLAIKAAEVARETVYAARAADKPFAQAWLEALDEAVDHLKAEARRRAVEGVDIPVVHEGQLQFVCVDPQGKYTPNGYVTDGPLKGSLKPGYQLVPFTKKQYSDALLQMLLKSGRPSEFGDKVQHQIPVGAEEEAVVLVHTAPPPITTAPAAED